MPLWTDLVKVELRDGLSEITRRWSSIRVLVVADTIVSLGPEQHPNNLNEAYFGMGHLLEVLEGVAVVTKAHRTVDPLDAPGVIENFRFDTTDLTRFDQIWLMGFGSGPGLPEAELKAVCTFMNNGGGVFATGDHASLGSALAANLPRVRSMRHWAPPPPPLGLDRVDTTMADANNIVVFENQSDAIPQKLRLKWYPWDRHRWFREVYPHPLLCSSAGPITEFPDHMHEGEVVVPSQLTDTIALSGMQFDEYPMDKNGVRVAPEVVAWGWTSGRASPEVMHDVHVGAPTSANPRWTGTVGAYDGRRANVGRVVVDSTWHHFFDINLIGDNAANRPSVTDPRAPIWQKGFTGTPDGQRVLGKIDQYFRNIVRWLSPSKGLWLFDALVTQLALSHKVREVIDAGDFHATEVGAFVWEEAVRIAPPCTIMELVLEPLYERFGFTPLPWDGPTPGPDDGPLPPWPVPPKHLAQAALGGALLSLRDIDGLEDLKRQGDDSALRRGSLAAIQQVLRNEVELSRSASSLVEALEARSANGE